MPLVDLGRQTGQSRSHPVIADGTHRGSVFALGCVRSELMESWIVLSFEAIIAVFVLAYGGYTVRVVRRRVRGIEEILRQSRTRKAE